MITINLLPPEYRRADATPIARFLAIIIGAVVLTSGMVVYGYVHYGELKSIRDVREAMNAEFTNKQAQADVSKSLQEEINAYETRRKTISDIASKRLLWSRKLDEFLDIIHNGGDRGPYFVWFKGLRIAPPRSVRRGEPSTGGAMSFGGHSETTDITKITNLRNTIRNSKFFDDFSSISMPGFEAEFWDDGMEPTSAGKFSFELTLKPLGWRRETKK